jgi:hypothetical protein
LFASSCSEKGKEHACPAGNWTLYSSEPSPCHLKILQDLADVAHSDEFDISLDFGLGLRRICEFAFHSF